MADNIVLTVSTAETVLAHFRQQLEQAGFADGALPYTRLVDTLIGQRLWSESSGMALEARFNAVGVHARALTELLQPYVNAFQRLSALASPGLLAADDGAVVGPDGTEDPLEAVANAVLGALPEAGQALSFTALRVAVQLPRQDLRVVLDRLQLAGKIERTCTSGRDLIRRTAP